MYFDESAASVVDTWLKTATGGEDVGISLESSKSSAKSAAAPPTHEGGKGRSGIGFQAPKKDAKTPDVLGDKFNKSMKKKRSFADMNTLADSHGIIEEEISKIKAPKASPAAPKPPSVPQITQGPPHVASNTASGAKGFSNNSNAGKSQSSVSQHTRDGSGSHTEQQKWSDRSKQIQQEKSEEKASFFGDREAGAKRKKTRSKQKNIRRDTRRDEFKPEHLRMGSKDYKGRPLTKVRKNMCIHLAGMLGNSSLDNFFLFF
jgi:hypothetical protein